MKRKAAAGPAPLKPEDQIRLAYAVGYMDGTVNEYSLVFGDRNVPLSEAVERYMDTLTAPKSTLLDPK